MGGEQLTDCADGVHELLTTWPGLLWGFAFSVYSPEVT